MNKEDVKLPLSIYALAGDSIIDANHKHVYHSPTCNNYEYFTYAQRAAFAARVVRAVNCHDALLAACKACEELAFDPQLASEERMFEAARLLRAAIRQAEDGI